MPTLTPPSHDAAIEAQVFWLRFKNEIATALLLVLLAIAGFAGYRLYTNSRDSAAAALLGNAKSAPDYQQVISRYPNTPAGASAYLLLAEDLRKEKKFAEANATLQAFINKNPDHELVPIAQMAIAANLEAMGKTDEALASYQQIASKYPRNFSAPLALISQVPLLKSKNRTDEARRVCETILTQYRDSFWANEAMRELRSLKPSVPSPAAAGSTTTAPPGGPGVPPRLIARPPMPAPSTAPPSGAPTPAAKKSR
jgi:predicted negative regulator of RcsB-dependent stress response